MEVPPPRNLEAGETCASSVNHDEEEQHVTKENVDSSISDEAKINDYYAQFSDETLYAMAVDCLIDNDLEIFTTLVRAYTDELHGVRSEAAQSLLLLAAQYARLPMLQILVQSKFVADLGDDSLLIDRSPLFAALADKACFALLLDTKLAQRKAAAASTLSVVDDSRFGRVVAWLVLEAAGHGHAHAIRALHERQLIGRATLDAVPHFVERVSNSDLRFGPYAHTPLMVAVKASSVDTVRALIEAGDFVLARSDLDDSTVLHMALRNGNVDMVKHLMQEMGFTGAAESSSSFAKLDFAQFATRRALGVFGTAQSVLHDAVQSRSLPLVQFLLEHSEALTHFDVNACYALQQFSGFTALHFAASLNLVSIARLLLMKYGAKLLST